MHDSHAKPAGSNAEFTGNGEATEGLLRWRQEDAEGLPRKEREASQKTYSPKVRSFLKNDFIVCMCI